jgi:hypothetical protein
MLFHRLITTSVCVSIIKIIRDMVNPTEGGEELPKS